MTFTIIRLRASSKLAFEEALGWQNLREHLDAMASIKGQVWSDRIGAALEHYDQADELILLRISDEGCRGLTGPELTTNEIDEADYGNFIKLCRLDLFSGKAQGSAVRSSRKAATGGSQESDGVLFKHQRRR